MYGTFNEGWSCSFEVTKCGTFNEFINRVGSFWTICMSNHRILLITVSKYCPCLSRSVENSASRALLIYLSDPMKLRWMCHLIVLCHQLFLWGLILENLVWPIHFFVWGFIFYDFCWFPRLCSGYMMEKIEQILSSISIINCFVLLRKLRVVNWWVLSLILPIFLVI